MERSRKVRLLSWWAFIAQQELPLIAVDLIVLLVVGLFHLALAV